MTTPAATSATDQDRRESSQVTVALMLRSLPLPAATMDAMAARAPRYVALTLAMNPRRTLAVLRAAYRPDLPAQTRRSFLWAAVIDDAAARIVLEVETDSETLAVLALLAGEVLSEQTVDLLAAAVSTGPHVPEVGAGPVADLTQVARRLGIESLIGGGGHRRLQSSRVAWASWLLDHPRSAAREARRPVSVLDAAAGDPHGTWGASRARTAGGVGASRSQQNRGAPADPAGSRRLSTLTAGEVPLAADRLRARIGLGAPAWLLVLALAQSDPTLGELEQTVGAALLPAGVARGPASGTVGSGAAGRELRGSQAQAGWWPRVWGKARAATARALTAAR